ncbi:MAG: glycosyltransferase family 2 protein [Chromatiales bacterium]
MSVVVPFYNESTTLRELMTRLAAATDPLREGYDFEFILVDDGSRDDGLRIARGMIAQEPRLRVIELRHNYGQTAALQAGLDAAKGNIIVSMDADLQHFPEEIPLFLQKIEEGNDVVCGWRHQRQETILRRWPSRMANYMVRRVSGLQIRDIGTTFRAYRREIMQDLRLLGENHRFVPVFAKTVGARIDEVPIRNITRPHGRSNYGLGRTLNVLIDVFFLYFFVRYLDRPIRIFGKVALASFVIAAVITLWLAWIWLDTGRAVVREHSGLFIVAVMLYLAAGQFLLAGILGEMLTRIYFSSHERAPYKIRRIWSHDTMG